ncbi:hypothetical protein AJ80_09029 [Polytolypa hystricis UAMH7299]|uniref:F-box domain-containing protein n=1 Tax=Polytolypa hystricis (strain UAMH7299) TaxID=1447883 RepID=A0A2B7WXL6_POLH7|nr:hypothetical protein AJ80_09029 [Polytolypa hystricis UAMH7299]
MPTALEVQTRKFRAAFDKASSYFKKYHEVHAHRRSESEPRLSRINTSSCWDNLPVELQISIFGLCRLQDIYDLRRVSRAFHNLIDIHEQAIAREYLRIRRHGSLPRPIDESSSYTREPQDDVILLSDLFPPSTARGGGGRGASGRKDAYTFEYLWTLKRRQEVCSKLAYYIADRVMDRYMHYSSYRSSFASKRDRKALSDRGIDLLQYKLTPLMFYTLFFLESYARARLQTRDYYYAEYLRGRLPALVQPSDRTTMYRDLQRTILQTPPFTDTATLISTHHCIHVLVTYLRSALSPEPPHQANDPCVSMLLTTCSLARIAEFFAAEKGGGNQRVMRREFMHNMQADFDRYRDDESAAKVFGGGQAGKEPPPVREIWFEAAKNEMRERGVLQHETEEWVVVWEGARISMGCQHCVGEEGWKA